MGDQTVKVAVRVRPLVKSENNRGCQNIIQKTPSQPQIAVSSGSKNDLYTFNFVFAPEDTQEMVYENAVKSMVLNLFQGYNVTILAYGQTGSGKTHTMGTAYDGSEGEDIGVIPRAVADIFDHMQDMTEFDFTVSCSFMELYQEKLYDLLSTQPRDQSIVDIREVKDNKIAIPNLTEIPVKDAKETTECLMKGSADRAVGSTAMNATSSRSHAIFTITLQKVSKTNPRDATSAKFHLVDLAGSERSKKTLTTGEQFKEGVKINQGLLALGNVISALGSANHSNQHIGYRDSKLTRLLQDSLGGNSMTLMIACISPADYNMEETLGTLRYADRARKIKNKPVINQDPKTAEINNLKAEVQKLRLELLSKSGIGEAVVEKCQECDKVPTKPQLQKQLREMAEKLQTTLGDIAYRENMINEYEDTIESLKQKITELKGKISKLDVILTSDMTPTEMDEYKKDVRDFIDTISHLDTHMIERGECIFESSRSTDSPKVMNDSSSVSEVEISKNRAEFIAKHCAYQDDLKNLRAELAVKEDLKKKLYANQQVYASYDSNQLDASAEIIAKLEKEKKELEDLLRSKNSTVSVKLAEERRKRVHQLETEITAMRKKNLHQEQLLKQREKDGGRIEKLSQEITEMKQLKVKLVRKMKSESEEFRQWRLEREKELTQLRAKDRKLKSEVAKKDQLHEKQLNVLKRKAEESNAVAKRYKEALQKQKNSKAAKPNGGAVNKSTWINEEIEVITSIVDMKHSFDSLVEVRAELNARLRALKREKPPNSVLIKSVEEEIEMRNAQISDLSSKINENNMETKSKQMSESILTVAEGRSAIKVLLSNVIDQRRNFNQCFAQARDQKNLMETYEERVQCLEQEVKSAKEEMRQKCNEMEKEHQEETAVLLQALTTKESQCEVVAILEKQLATKDEEIEMLRQLIPVKKPFEINQKRVRPTSFRDSMHIDLFSEDSEVDSDNSDDSDYRGTPLHLRKRRTQLKTSRTTSLASSDVTASDNSTVNATKTKCKCKAGCKVNCGCSKKQIGCSGTCFCKASCQNTFNEMSTTNSSVKRSVSQCTESESEQTDENKENQTNEHTPKKIRVESEVLPYVYSVKKRNPVF